VGVAITGVAPTGPVTTLHEPVAKEVDAVALSVGVAPTQAVILAPAFGAPCTLILIVSLNVIQAGFDAKESVSVHTRVIVPPAVIPVTVLTGLAGVVILAAGEVPAILLHLPE